MSRRIRERASNIPSQLLSDKENETLFQILGRSCVTLATGITQLYLADTNGHPNRWNKRFCGVACFIKDSSKRSYYIRIYDLRKEILLWEQELYNQFRYKSPREFFHTFEADAMQAGLNFASEDEAVNFKKAVETKLQERHQRKMDRKQQSVKASNKPEVPSAAPATNINAPLTVNTESNKNGTTKKNKNEKGNKKKHLTKDDIGTPTNFRHVGHVGWDPTKGFDMNNLEPDMKMLFQSVGISKDDPVDKETIDFIYDFVDKAGGMEAFRKDMQPHTSATGAPNQQQVSALPPPRSPSGAPPPPQRLGPPLPPSRNVPTRGSAPPPPPVRTNTAAAPKAPSVPPPRPPMASPSVPPPRPPIATSSAPSAPSAPVPPPPPPPPGAPPPPSSDVAVPSGHGALLEEIRSSGGKGMTLNPVQTNSNSGGQSDPHTSLLSQIRGGTQLKKVEAQETQSVVPEEEGGGLVGALARALATRQKHIQGSDEESDESEEDANDDDSDWED